MNKTHKYTQFSLIQEMLETIDVVRNFSIDNCSDLINNVKKSGKLFLTGEGSSRIFPAKNAIYTAALNQNHEVFVVTEGARQASEYNLSEYVILGASNSGSTKEVISFFNTLKESHKYLYGLTARPNTLLSNNAVKTYQLKCGWENAVAATKSVIEQALFYQEIVSQVNNYSILCLLDALADSIELALTTEIPGQITEKIANAGTVYFAGRNDGVAEELTLKTNEITRKRSDYLEGTYALHGIEEVMDPGDVVIFINPFDEELDKIKETLVDNIGLTVIAISDKETLFPTIKINNTGILSNYAYLATGWNMLVEVGMYLGINLDKTARARKIGNEFVSN